MSEDGANQWQSQHTASRGITDLPMNWYKFIIFFQLFGFAISSVYSGFIFITGSVLETDDGMRTLLYAAYPALKPFLIMFGIFQFAFAALAIFVRQKLVQFRKNAPQLYWALLVANVVSAMVALAGLSAILSGIPTDSTSTMQLVVGVMMVVANVLYFRRRMHLFVN